MTQLITTSTVLGADNLQSSDRAMMMAAASISCPHGGWALMAQWQAIYAHAWQQVQKSMRPRWPVQLGDPRCN